VTITGNPGVRDVLLSLVPTGVITGRVTNQSNEPLSRVYVRASGDKKNYETQTNDAGEYRLYDLAPGNYSVSVSRYMPPFVEGGTATNPTADNRSGQEQQPVGLLYRHLFAQVPGSGFGATISGEAWRN
jgi:hypothetical protein